MDGFTEQDFERLIEDKGFAEEALLFKSNEMLRSAYQLCSKEPEKRDKIIRLISWAILTHLNSKDKFKVIHALSLGMRSGFVLGLRNLYSLGASKVIEFNNALGDSLSYIEIKEGGKVLERKEIIKELNQKGKNIARKGFKTELTHERIKTLFEALKGEYIDKGTKLKNFTAVFRDSPLPEDFLEVKWILENREGRPHKTALREFLTFVLGKSPNQKITTDCFLDRYGMVIQLSKPKVSQASNHYIFFQKLFKE